MRIMIADDNETDRAMLHGLLKAQGHCKLCCDGSNAIGEFKRAIETMEPFNLVCLDIAISDIEGTEVLKQFRALEKQHGLAEKKSTAVIVITTSLGDVKHILAATKSGCNGYLTKPIDQERLYAELCKLGLKIDWTAKPNSAFKG